MRTPKVPEFRLRFPIGDVQKWADAYRYEDDSEVIRIGKRAGERGWYTLKELRIVAEWKTDRSKSRVALNTEAAVVDATRLCGHLAFERLAVCPVIPLLPN